MYNNNYYVANVAPIGVCYQQSTHVQSYLVIQELRSYNDLLNQI